MNLSELKEIIQKEVKNTLTPKIEKIKSNEMDSILDVGDKAFGTFDGYSNIVSKNPEINHKEQADWDKSIKMVLGKKIIGYYLLSDKKSIGDFINYVIARYHMQVIVNDKKLLDFAKKNKGIQGLSVGILPEYKGKGYSKFLFDYPKTTNYKYIWAVQTKGLSNLNGW